jgi:Na+/citrate or Na+/malate symporter
MNIKNITWPVALVGTIVVMLLTYTKNLPNNVMGAYGLMFILGLVFGEIGSRVKFIDEWLGGGPIMCIFGPALMLYFGILPDYTVKLMKDFMNASPTFFDFFITFLICGAMLSIARRILVQSTLKFLPTILGGLVVSAGFAALAGFLTGYGPAKAVMILAVPIMGGGVGAGALPLSQIYAKSGGLTAEQMLSLVMPAVILGNVLSIFFAIILKKIGANRPNLTGYGNIMRVDDSALRESLEAEKRQRAAAPITIENLGVGFFVCIVFFLTAFCINKFLVPSVHTFVWLILLLTLAKAFKVLPDHLEICTIQWSQTWVKNLLFAALVPIGIGYMNIQEVLGAITDPAYVLISVVTVIGAVVGAGLVGWLLKLYPIEAAIAGGLCMSNMAQTGDLATLAAANRMELLPYSAYSSRIGGSVVLVMAGILASLIGLGAN